MTKKVFRLLTSVLLVSALCAGSAFAFNPLNRDDSSRVTVAQNDVGDALLGQIYHTVGDFQTRIKVVNSSETQAVVARINFRSALCSTHVFDFIIYLTPTDAWEGVVSRNAAGNVQIYSADDSVMYDERYEWDGVAPCNPFSGKWASEATPLVREFYTDFLTAGDTIEFGHFEVVGLAAFNATAPMSKDTLAMAYGNMTGVPAINLAALAACDFNLISTTMLDAPNSLFGTITLEHEAWNQRASIPMVALKNYNNLPNIAPTGQEVGLARLTSYNSVPEIEAALAKTEYSLPFNFKANEGDADIFLVNTLPTLYLAGTNDFVTESGQFARPCVGMGNLQYKVFDMEETRLVDILSGDRTIDTLPEVSMQPLTPVIQEQLDNGYLEGWVNVEFAGWLGEGAALDSTYLPPVPANTNLPPVVFTNGWRVAYAGAATINSYITITKDNDLIWNYAASPESVVTYTNLASRTYNPDGTIAVDTQAAAVPGFGGATSVGPVVSPRQ